MPKVMIVDDSETLRMSVKKVLESGGLDVIEAENGAKGLEVFKANSADVRLILTDYNMPEMDGIAMVRKIRELSSGGDVNVFMLTTESSPDLKALGKEANIKAWVTKPFNEEKLIGAVKKMLGV
jgi:two-component system chemotaxis response regulator CheY